MSPAGTASRTLLRPALEAAVSVARAGDEATPIEPPPPALRPFLHFAKLPRPALVAARRVLDADDEFRARVLDAVTESDVGRSGWIYLARPDGWEDELAALLANAADAGAAAGERRAEGDARKRLAGAEAARRRAEDAWRWPKPSRPGLWPRWPRSARPVAARSTTWPGSSGAWPRSPSSATGPGRRPSGRRPSRRRAAGWWPSCASPSTRCTSPR